MPAKVKIAEFNLHGPGSTLWTVESDRGVVKVFSSRDGCIAALAPSEARKLAETVASALQVAVDNAEIRSYGKVISRAGSY